MAVSYLEKIANEKYSDDTSKVTLEDFVEAFEQYGGLFPLQEKRLPILFV